MTTYKLYPEVLISAILRWDSLKRAGIGGAERQQVLDDIRMWAPRNVTVTPEWVTAQAARLREPVAR